MNLNKINNNNFYSNNSDNLNINIKNYIVFIALTISEMINKGA
jgi:hypothetical protein